MIKADFLSYRNGMFFGFIISGHANTGRYGHDILCAGVSSSVMLTINTITRQLGLKSKKKTIDNKIGFKILNPDENGSKIIEALIEHLRALDIGYNKIRIKFIVASAEKGQL
ncbi:MAG: ribosomal-processing cysteine protease Prp [Eubacterium sp.]|jgi:uncharacterized protein YsxB (DUF464 family)|nr:ribosomal-processing cysteine protease Prp [Eubacterium sp.]